MIRLRILILIYLIAQIVTLVSTNLLNMFLLLLLYFKLILMFFLLCLSYSEIDLMVLLSLNSS
jgi:hypothetical protein